jgi:hypothetical protein
MVHRGKSWDVSPQVRIAPDIIRLRGELKKMKSLALEFLSVSWLLGFRFQISARLIASSVERVKESVCLPDG